MADLEHEFSSLASSVEELHQVLDQWSRTKYLGGSMSTEVKVRTRLIVHEWIANLVQHATFNGQNPRVCLEINVHSDERIEVAIADNSAGFSVGNKSELAQKLDSDELPQERGLGLPLIVACTRGLRYDCPKNKMNRLKFELIEGDGHA